ncbi:MAG: hypothetical protein Q8927_17170 [Bacteroidota bacterium]|nr:hypothetical protein [Bacteroidota bacterium]
MMTDRIAEGIMTYLWMKPQAPRSLQSIDKLYKYLCGPGERDYLRKGREALRSLMVQGSIEFAPQNNVRLSPSNALYAQGNFFFTNLPLASGLGFAEALDVLKKNKIPMQKFRLQTILSSMGTLESVVMSWDKAKLINTDAFQVRTDQGWAPAEKSMRDGVYRISPHPYSQSYLRCDGNWITIPRWEENIDGYRMAAFFSESAVIRGGRQLSYDPEKGILTVRLRNLPLVIERLLYINTALADNEYADLRGRKYCLTSAAVRKLNQLLDDTITTT